MTRIARWSHSPATNLPARGPAVPGEFIQDCGQLVQLDQVGPGQLGHQPVAPGRQHHPDDARVAGIGAAANQPGRLGPVQEFHRAVVTQSRSRRARQRPEGGRRDAP